MIKERIYQFVDVIEKYDKNKDSCPNESTLPVHHEGCWLWYLCYRCTITAIFFFSTEQSSNVMQNMTK